MVPIPRGKTKGLPAIVAREENVLLRGNNIYCEREKTEEKKKREKRRDNTIFSPFLFYSVQSGRPFDRVNALSVAPPSSYLYLPPSPFLP